MFKTENFVFCEEAFPLLKLIISDNPRARLAFDDGLKGGHEEKTYFAVGIYIVIANVTFYEIPGATEEIYIETMRSCRAVFEQGAASGDNRAKFFLHISNKLLLSL